jgi:hypothetical protein
MNHAWLKDQSDQQKLLSGGSFPPNVQWIARSKWLWPVQQMICWGMGPALGITAWLGVVFAALYAFGKRQGAWLVPLAWVLGYLAFMGAQFRSTCGTSCRFYPTLTVLCQVVPQAWRWAASTICSQRSPAAACRCCGRRIALGTPAWPARALTG